MRNTKHERKSSRRRSWFIGNSLLNMFSSAPPSPEYNKEVSFSTSPRQRSHSLTPIDDKLKEINQQQQQLVRPLLRSNQKSTFSSFLSKTKKKPLAIQTTIYDDQCSRKSTDTSMSTPLQIFGADEDEADRIQLKNDLVKLAFDGEFSLPLDYRQLSKGKILDIGCGPGAWCIDLATKYPQLEVIGVDSHDMFPLNLPSNCQLLVKNVLTGLTDFPESSFDVIHIRFMVLAFTLEQYPNIVKDCWRLLKPGGYIEILETDLTVHSAGPVTNRLNEQILEVAMSKGLNPKIQSESLTELVPKDANELQMNYRSIPMGVWGGRIGVLCRDDMINMLTKFQPYIYSNQTFDQDISIARKEMDEYKSFSNYYFCTAQKPHLPTSPLPLQERPTLQSKPSLHREYTSSVNPKSF